MPRLLFATGIGVLFVLGGTLFLRQLMSANESGRPSRHQLEAEMAEFRGRFGLSNDHYFDRGSLVGIASDGSVAIEPEAFASFAGTSGWTYVGKFDGPYFVEHRFCKGRLSLNLEQGSGGQGYSIASLRWTSSRRSPAYCGP
ncbi:hypothetical protein [Lysobacter tyrosinilyticus]